MQLSRKFVSLAFGFGQVALVSSLLIGRSLADEGAQESKLTEPVYRVATETPAAVVAQAPAPVAAAPAAAAITAAPIAAAPAATFDLTQQPGEHPLAPMIRVMKVVLANFDQNVHDYTCKFQKQERIEGDLGEPQNITLRVLSQPFSVYMYFNQPYTGREVLFVDGQRNNELMVLDCGFKRHLGKLTLDPNGTFAMSGQKYPITNAGIRYLTSEIINVSTADLQYGESEVKVDYNSHIGTRPATLIQITHPTPRKNFRAYISRIFLDNELRVPVHYDAYTWPTQPGQMPTVNELEETYTYADLKLNTGLTAADFDDKNPNIFKP
jgi:Protein of unknown function (DUF1571)